MDSNERSLYYPIKELLSSFVLNNCFFGGKTIDKLLEDRNYEILRSLKHSDFDVFRVSLSDIYKRYSRFYDQMDLVESDIESSNTNIFENAETSLGNNTKFRTGELADSFSFNKHIYYDFYLKSRRHETLLKLVLRGRVDIDRKFLISYIVFTGQSNLNSINTILISCGFDNLQETRSTDYFFINLIKSTNKEHYIKDFFEKLLINKRSSFLAYAKLDLKSENFKSRSQLLVELDVLQKKKRNVK